MVTGSGPTAFGLYPTVGDATAAAELLREGFPGAMATAPLTP
jgi:4-diphosphocytidyl-2C-methyl-D-erythritol kinase